jgi:hypothetical protein
MTCIAGVVILTAALLVAAVVLVNAKPQYIGKR